MSKLGYHGGYEKLSWAHDGLSVYRQNCGKTKVVRRCKEWTWDIHICVKPIKTLWTDGLLEVVSSFWHRLQGGINGRPSLSDDWFTINFPRQIWMDFTFFIYGYFMVIHRIWLLFIYGY